MAELTRRGGRVYPPRIEGFDGESEDASLRILLKRLNEDASQFVHDEMDLAKLELREVAETLSAEVHEAGKTLAKDLAKLGVALALALLGGFALTAGLILGIGVLLGGAFWAGGLIVGAVLLIAAAIAAGSAAKDARESEALRLERTKQTARHDRQVIGEEVRETKEFARTEAARFKDHATRDVPARRH